MVVVQPLPLVDAELHAIHLLELEQLRIPEPQSPMHVLSSVTAEPDSLAIL